MKFFFFAFIASVFARFWAVYETGWFLSSLLPCSLVVPLLFFSKVLVSKDRKGLLWLSLVVCFYAVFSGLGVVSHGITQFFAILQTLLLIGLFSAIMYYLRKTRKIRA